MPVIENLTLILSLVLGLITLISYVIRAATKNTNAIARLTLILHQLDETLRDMQAEISENRRRFEDRLDGHDSRLAALEARAIPIRPMSPNPALQFYFLEDPDGYTVLMTETDRHELADAVASLLGRGLRLALVAGHEDRPVIFCSTSVVSGVMVLTPAGADIVKALSRGASWAALRAASAARRRVASCSRPAA